MVVRASFRHSAFFRSLAVASILALALLAAGPAAAKDGPPGFLTKQPSMIAPVAPRSARAVWPTCSDGSSGWPEGLGARGPMRASRSPKARASPASRPVRSPSAASGYPNPSSPPLNPPPNGLTCSEDMVAARGMRD